jgi:hypothetical protein
MAEFLTEINEDLTQEELDTLYGIGLLGIAEQEEAEAIATEVQAQLPELNPKQIELGLQFATKLLGEDYEIPNYKLAEIQSQILDWNIVRNNIDYDEASELDMYASEAKEEIDAEGDIHEIIDANCDKYVLFTGALGKSGYANKGLSEAMLINYEDFKKIPKRVKSLGYCFRKAMKECLAEINSREQDLTQAKEWAENGASGKWEKNKSQNPDTIYKADYSKALICKDCDGKER